MNLNFKQTNSRVLEVILVLTTLVLTCVLYQTVGYKIIVLNLFYPPVILAAFFLGRYRAGVLAFFSVLSASIVLSFNLGEFAAYDSPLVVALSVLVWGGVLGLAALLCGTLSDDLASRMTELHEAHVGVVEVLSHYLQSAHPSLKDHSHRVASICRELAEQLKLGQKEVDDIRVAALLCDMENIEITARVIRKAIGDLGDEPKPGGQHTFHGTELVQSLGPVLLGAFPLVLNQSESGQHRALGEGSSIAQVPLGARIIRTVRAYDALIHSKWGLPGTTPAEAIKELWRDVEAEHDPMILHALERVVTRGSQVEKALVGAGTPADAATVGAV
ncbi:MAG TPA: HD domain-containing phosphohydrolase [Planctomycetaceae bacterium]|nr:HD domain-containing phosphohydrolase [Planctomycetaceae bacterium]